MQSASCQRVSFAAAILIALGWMASSSPLHAQPADAVPEQVVAQPTPSLVERLIYVPYRNLQAVFDKQGSTAVLPYSEYLKLVEAALQHTLRRPAQPPIAGVITSARYVGTVDAETVDLTATLQIQALENGWAEIPIRFGDAAIGEISSDSGKVLLRGTGPGTYALLIPTAGEHTVTLKLTTRVRTSPEGQSLELDVPAVGITTLELSIPQADQAVELEPKLVIEPVAGEGNLTRIQASVGSTEKITARWHPKVGNKPDMQLLTNATAATAVSVEDGVIHTDTWLQFDVLRGQLEKVRLAIPKGQRILDVSSDAKLKEWAAVEEGERQILNVEFLSRLTGKATLEVHLERDLPSEPFDVFGLTADAAFGVHALDVVRESGQIAVRSAGDMTLAVEQQQGVQRLDEGEADARLRRPGALYFKYYSPAGRLRLQAKPVEPRLLAQHATHVIIGEDRLRTNDQFQFTIDRAGIFELKFKIPDDLTIENVTCDKMKQFDVSPDKKTLTISLLEKALGALNVTITGSRNADFATLAAEQPVPILEPVGVELETGSVLIYASSGIEVITEATSVVSAQPDQDSDPLDLPDAQLVSAWSFTRRPVTIPVRLVRKPTRLTAYVGTTIDVKQGQVQVKTQVQYSVEYAGLDTFRISVPEALADLVQITAAAGGPVIKQKSRATEAVDGWVAWTIELQREVTGLQEFTVTYDVTPTVDEQKAERSKIELLQVLDPYPDAAAAGSKQLVSVSRITGEATVLKDRALSVTPVPSGGDVEPIDVRELTRLPADGFTAYRYFQQPVVIELTAEKFDVQGVVEVVASRALVEVVLDRTGTATCRARYLLKSSERQRLPIELPQGAELLGVSVDRKPVSLERNAQSATAGWDAFFVNVARTKPSDQSFSIAVMYRFKLEPIPFAERGGDLDLRLPRLGGAENSGVAVQQMRVAVWVPDEYALVGTPTEFTVESRPNLTAFFFGRRGPKSGDDLEGWIGSEAGGVFDFPTEGRRHVYGHLGQASMIKPHWWHLPFYTWIISGAIVLIALVLRNTGCENKLTILFLAIFAAAAYALSNRDVIVYGLGVASYGLLIGAGLWFVHGLVGRKTMVCAPTPPASSPPTPPADGPTTPIPAS